MLVWIVVFGEIVLGVLLTFAFAGQKLVLISLGVLVVYTAQIAYLLLSDTAPACSCLKLWNAYLSDRESNWWALLRNGALIGALVVALIGQLFASGKGGPNAAVSAG